MADFFSIITTDSAGRQQELALAQGTPAGDVTVPANYTAVVVRQLTIASGKKLTIGSGARLRIL